MAADLAIDPDTHAFIETDDGAWLETEDSRTAVLMQLDCRRGEWWGDPDAGSYIPAMLDANADPNAPAVEIEDIRNEALRALQALVSAGVISDLRIGITELDSTNGLGALLLTWRDRASNRPVDLVYSAFGGVPR